MEFEPKKLYYKIREASKIVGVESYVLRFWETQFPMLMPPKTKSGQRIYRPKDIELLLEIRKLLYEEGFTIAGARKKLASGGRAAARVDGAETGATAADTGKSAQPLPEPVSEPLSKVKSELENILTLLDRQ